MDVREICRPEVGSQMWSLAAQVSAPSDPSGRQITLQSSLVCWAGQASVCRVSLACAPLVGSWGLWMPRPALPALCVWPWPLGTWWGAGAQELMPLVGSSVDPLKTHPCPDPWGLPGKGSLQAWLQGLEVKPRASWVH